MEGLRYLSNVGRWGFPVKDLTRRKFQTALTITSLAICVSVTIFLALFGANLGVELGSVAEGRLTIGFSGVLSRFILLVVLFNSVAGVMVAYFLMTISTSERTRDIGIMKAVGCLTDVVFSYFATELSVIVIAGCLLGTVGGILLDYASIGLMNLLGFPISAKPANPWLVILITCPLAFVFYIIGMRRIVKAAGIEPVKALSPPIALGASHQSSFRLPLRLRVGFAAKVAFRDLGRRRSMTIQSLACLSVTMGLMTLAVVGGTVANETMQSYTERAIGRNVVLVANPEIASHYERLLQKFLEAGLTEQVDCLNQSYVISNSIISRLSGIDGVTRVDPRLITEATVHGYQHIRADPETPGQYIVTGTDRYDEALIIGVHPENLVNDWLILGGNLLSTDPQSVLVGDSLGLTLFDNPWIQDLGFSEERFRIAGLCLDPLNNGMVVYVSFDRLSVLVAYMGPNVLLLQTASSGSLSRSRVLDEIEAALSGTGLTMLDLNVVLDRHTAFLNYLWSVLLSLSLFCFVNAISSLGGYLMLSISGQQRDLGVMRALGARPRTAVKFVLLQTLLLVSASGFIGASVGTVIVFWFFIPEAIVSQRGILTIVGLLSSLVAVLCLSSLYPARKIARVSIPRAISQT